MLIKRKVWLFLIKIGVSVTATGRTLQAWLRLSVVRVIIEKDFRVFARGC